MAQFLIEKDQITIKNDNRSHGIGVLYLRTFEPFAKSPAISKVFREIGFADELGSGMRNSYKYTKLYSGAEPEFIEDDIFRIIIPLTTGAMTKVGPGSGDDIENVDNNTKTNTETNTEINITDTERKIIEIIKANPMITISGMSEASGLSKSGVQYVLNSLKKKEILRREGAQKNGRWILHVG